MASHARKHSTVQIIYKVRFKDYVRIIEAPENRHLRMAYHDGTLEIVSPKLSNHEVPSDRLRIITSVATRLGLTYDGTGSYTYRRSGEGPYRGKGKEPDQSFYFANTSPENRLAPLIRGVMGLGPFPTPQDIGMRVSVSAVVNFWFFAIYALAGGRAGALLARRGRAGASTRGTNDA